MGFSTQLGVDSCDAWEYIIILRCGIMYNLFSKFFCRQFVLPKN